VSTNYSVSEHIYQPAAILFNKGAYDKWPAEVKAGLAKANEAVLGKLRKDVRAMTPILLDNLGASGVKVNVLSAAERAPFQKLAEQARKDYLKGASKSENALYVKIQDALKKKRGQ
jgi:TRAP-type C4-dicarboxylate transport system substrate-binding protein